MSWGDVGVSEGREARVSVRLAPPVRLFAPFGYCGKLPYPSPFFSPQHKTKTCIPLQYKFRIQSL